MRTTLSLSDELHAQLVSISRDRQVTVSRAVEELLQRALRGETSPQYEMATNRYTGFLGARLGRRLTEDDVRSLDDDE